MQVDEVQSILKEVGDDENAVECWIRMGEGNLESMSQFQGNREWKRVKVR